MSGQVLDQLASLQAVSDKVDELEARRNEAKDVKERVEGNLERLRDELAAKQEEFHTVDMERRKREVRLREEKDRLQRIKGRVGEVKTSREYQAVQSETNSANTAIKECEDELLSIMETVEQTGAEVELAKDAITKVEGDAAESSEAYDKILAETETEIASLKEREKELLKELPGDVAGRYKMIRQRRGGVAVVEARDEACTACFMHIPPQTYIEVVRQSRVVICPNCHRILIPPRETPATGDESGE